MDEDELAYWGYEAKPLGDWFGLHEIQADAPQIFLMEYYDGLTPSYGYIRRWSSHTE